MSIPSLQTFFWLPVFWLMLSVAHAESPEADTLPSVEVKADEFLSQKIAQRIKNWSLEHHDMQISHKENMGDLGNRMPGTRISQNASGSSGIILTRGTRAGLGQVSLDGVPLFSSMIGVFPLGRYPIEYFDQIRFAGSYDGENMSSRGLSGGIQLKSRRLQDKHGFVHTEGGSYGTLRNYAGLGLQAADTQLTVIGGRSDIFEGISQAAPTSGSGERDKFAMNNVLVRLDKEFNQGALEASMFYSTSAEHQDGPGVIGGTRLKPVLGWQDQSNGYLNGETWVAQTQGEYVFNSANSTRLRFGFTQNQDQGLIGCIPLPSCRLRVFSMDMNSQLGMLNWQNTHAIPLNFADTHFVFHWGVETQLQQGDSPYNPSRVYTMDNRVVSPYGRLEADWQKWFLASDIRSDHYDHYGDPKLFNFSLGRRLSEQSKLWFSFGNGYRQPSVNELLHPLFGSTRLSPESTHGGEIAFDWKKDKHNYVTVKGFYQQYSQMMIAAQANPTTTFQVSNIPQAEIKGMEFDASMAWNAQWYSGLAYNYNEVVNLTAHRDVPYRPHHFGKFWTEYRITPELRWYSEVNFRTGQWADISNQIYIKGVPRVGTRLEYDAYKNLTTYVRAENLNDDKTPELYRFYAMGFAAYAGFVFKW